MNHIWARDRQRCARCSVITFIKREIDVWLAEFEEQCVTSADEFDYDLSVIVWLLSNKSNKDGQIIR